MSDPFIGEIRIVGFDFAPRGWAFANGGLLPIAQNTALFTLLGARYGGNGVNTFGLPDFRGRSPIGFGQGPGLGNIVQGELAGAENLTLTQAQLPAHTHLQSGQVSIAIPATTSDASSQIPSSKSVLAKTIDQVAGAEVKIYAESASTTTLAPFSAAVTGSIGVAGQSAPVPIRNPYLGINFIIALEGLFPSRP